MPIQAFGKAILCSVLVFSLSLGSSVLAFADEKQPSPEEIARAIEFLRESKAHQTLKFHDISSKLMTYGVVTAGGGVLVEYAGRLFLAIGGANFAKGALKAVEAGEFAVGKGGEAVFLAASKQAILKSGVRFAIVGSLAAIGMTVGRLAVYVGGVSTAIGLGMYIFEASTANGAEFSQAFISSPEGFNMVLDMPTASILEINKSEPELGIAIVNVANVLKNGPQQ